MRAKLQSRRCLRKSGCGICVEKVRHTKRLALVLIGMHRVPPNAVHVRELDVRSAVLLDDAVQSLEHLEMRLAGERVQKHSCDGDSCIYQSNARNVIERNVHELEESSHASISNSYQPLTRLNAVSIVMRFALRRILLCDGNMQMTIFTVLPFTGTSKTVRT